jgi:hypothetical protein
MLEDDRKPNCLRARVFSFPVPAIIIITPYSMIARSILVINFYKYRIYIYDKITKNLENKFEYPTKWNIKSHLV